MSSVSLLRNTGFGLRDPVLLSDSEGALRASEQARAGKRFGLDTEFLRERTFRARLCLVQAATPDAVYVFDPLTEIDLLPIGRLVADPEVEVVVHAGRQDLELFVELFGSIPSNVFDVQLAAGFVGLGASLPYGRLVEETVGVPLKKGESYTDWCRRPLTASQLSYAADDVRYLLAIADVLKQRLDALGRLTWVREEMATLENEETYLFDPSEAWRRVAGKGALTGRQAAVLRELAGWRERVAEQRNTPRGWVVKDPTLIEMARRSPGDVAALKGIRGLNTKEADRSGREIVAAINRGRSAPTMSSPPSPPRGALARARMLSGMADAIVRARCEGARIAAELVATRGELEAILAAQFSGTLNENGHRLLRGWRRELAGQAVLNLAAGKVAVRVVDHPPYVEEVPT